ncbi:MAG: response regulator [Planctomycetota bacterium]|jgi:two-component system alkaline phosphatase synthesis response regulator PhoP
MSKRILVIDDEPHILQVLSLKLGNAGYEVLTAIDGESGLEEALAHQPDLIITDVQMPYLNGVELCRALVDNEKTSRIPVIILTARGYALQGENMQVPNITDVVSKPFSPRALLELVASRLEGSIEQPENEAA